MTIYSSFNFLGEKETLKSLISWAKTHPFEDYLCAKINTDSPSLGLLSDSDNTVIGGSSAVKVLLSQLAFYRMEEFLPWEENDVDFFCLDQKFPYCESFCTKLQIIHVKEKTVEQLLLSFDLPICRVVFDFKGNLCFTAQALYSALKRRMHVPLYMRDKQQFLQQVTSWSEHNDIVGDDLRDMTNLADEIWCNFDQRSRKYLERGFARKFIETQVLTPSLMGRLEYIKQKKYYRFKVTLLS